MKKKFLLFVIPALLAITACSGIKSNNFAKEQELVEDTLAHEEIFGKVEVSGKLGVRKTVNPENVLQPKIGVQWQKSDNNDNDSTKITIRYVAAISSLDVQAKWYRGVAKPDSNCPKKFYNDGAYDVQESLTAYSVINNDGNVTKPADLGNGYIRFVVYTLRNIPYLEYRHGYMAAYLELCDSVTGEHIISSDVVAVNIDQKHYFSFNESDLDKDGTPGIDRDGFFMEGTINGIANTVIPLNEAPEGTDTAKKTGISLKANDHFGVFKYTGQEFVFYGRYNFAKDDTLYYTEINDSYSPNYCKVGATGTFSIKLDNNHMYTLTASEANVEIYMETNGNWEGGRYAVYLMDSSAHEVGWVDMTYDSTISKHKCTINLVNTPLFILCRMNPETSENNWNNKWTQTDNIGFDSSTNSANSDSSIFHTIFKITKHWNQSGNATYNRY